MRGLRKDVSLVVMMAMIIVFVSSCGGQVVAISTEQSKTDVSRNDGAINAVRNMSAKRFAHTATLMSNGKVLVAGGLVGDEGVLTSAEVFDPSANSFTSAGSMMVARASQTATLLPNGKILMAGGFNGDYLNSAELYDPHTGKFTPAGQMVTPRSGHVAVLLNNGKVLLAGGTGTGWTFLADAEIYDPTTDAFTSTGKMTTVRESHTATLLKDGKVLITAGHKGRRADMTIYSSAEIYNPVSGAFTPTGNLKVKRHKHDATLLADGRVLIIGGADERDGRGAYTSTEIYTPATGTFTALGNLNTSRYKLNGTSILLPTGKVLIAGGASKVEIFDPKTNEFIYAAGDMGTMRLFATATLLQNGQVLITGGYDDANATSASAWIYKS